MASRDARRRRILQGGQQRLAIITGRKPEELENSNPRSLPLNGQTSATYAEEETPSHSAPSTQPEKPVTPIQNEPLHTEDNTARPYQNEPSLQSQIQEEPILRKPEPRAESSRAQTTADTSRAVSSPAPSVPKPVLVAADLAFQLAQKIPITNVSAQQVNIAVATSEHERLLCTLIMAILVILTFAGMPIMSTRIIRWIFLFRPLFVLIIVNIGLIMRRLIPECQKNSARGDNNKDDMSALLGPGLGWAEEAGRALELGLMLQCVARALFTDCMVYAVVIVFFLSPFV